MVALVGLTAGSKVWSSGLALAAALGAAALGLIPWGTGRTDMVLYPAFALLVAFGVDRIVRAASRRAPSAPIGAIAAVVVAVVLTVGMARSDIEHPAHYPAFDARQLMRELAVHEQAGDLVFVQLTRPLSVGAPVAGPSEAGVRLGLGRRVHGHEHPARSVHRAVLQLGGRPPPERMGPTDDHGPPTLVRRWKLPTQSPRPRVPGPPGRGLATGDGPAGTRMRRRAHDPPLTSAPTCLATGIRTDTMNP